MPDTKSEKIDWSILIVIILGTFMAILDSSIVNVALPKMMAIFNASTDDIEWILTAYMLTLGVIMPISGFLGDRFGYKRIYILALSLFVVGSGLCGLAWNLPSMIFARVIQALGGGIMQPLGMALIYRSFPRSKMGMVLGFWGIAAMAAPAIGPTLGGYLVDYVYWRLIFYINVPIGLLNIFLAGLLLTESPLIKGHHFDFVGLISSCVGLFCLLLAISKGTTEGWTSLYILTLEIVAFTSLAIFVFNELTHPEPLLDLRMFKNKIFTLSIVIGALIAMGLFGAIFLIPLMLQNFLGQSAMKTGLIMFPAALASSIMMPVSGRLYDKYGARWVVIFGLAVVSYSTYVMGSFGALTSFFTMMVWMTVRGGGMAFCFMPITTAGMNSIPQHLVGRASALSNVIRQVAASFGVAMMTTIMQHRQVAHLAQLANSVNMSSNDYIHIQEALSGMAVTRNWSMAQAQGVGLGYIDKLIVIRSYIESMDDCFVIAALLCLFALVLCLLFLKDDKKRQTPAALPNEPPAVALET
ncbi:MAG TPA: DHA2 family efflux MFS transporter permease subunit [Syntrophomonadaceae bacterium]|nr:DHA2 family efflux MFS transporter permease subunit [Syntrophomonadaceae bacterium]